jgi:replication factor A1
VQKTEFLVKVVINKIDSSWWYNACSKCKRTAKRYGNLYKCSYSKCNTIGASQQRFVPSCLCVLLLGQAKSELIHRQGSSTCPYGTRLPAKCEEKSLSHPEISKFQDVNRKKFKQRFSLNFKILPNTYFLYRKYSIGKKSLCDF